MACIRKKMKNSFSTETYFKAAGRPIVAQINLENLTNNINILRQRLKKPNAGFTYIYHSYGKKYEFYSLHVLIRYYWCCKGWGIWSWISIRFETS